jgi:hypothetical protein
MRAAIPVRREQDVRERRQGNRMNDPVILIGETLEDPTAILARGDALIAEQRARFAAHEARQLVGDIVWKREDSPISYVDFRYAGWDRHGLTEFTRAISLGTAGR